jgi:limonene-1,2-epoxide hydrolase
MTSSPEESVRALFAALGEGPAGHDTVLTFLTPDASYHMNAWHEPKSGHDEIRAELERQSALFVDLRSELVRVLADDSHVAVERLDHMSIGGKPVTLHFAGSFDFDAAGKITAWRDYFDMSEVAAKAQG